MKVRVAVLAFVGLAFLSVGAEAQGNACFDWSCNSSTGYCTFNPGCSSIDSPGFLWRYSWDFGDGSGDLTSSSTSHTYSTSGGCYYPWVELTVIPFNTNPFSVQCQITVWECVGPPQGTSGRCDN